MLVEFGFTSIPAVVMELVDMPDLGSGAARRGGSTPFSRTKASRFEGPF